MWLLGIPGLLLLSLIVFICRYDARQMCDLAFLPHQAICDAALLFMLPLFNYVVNACTTVPVTWEYALETCLHCSAAIECAHSTQACLSWGFILLAEYHILQYLGELGAVDDDGLKTMQLHPCCWLYHQHLSYWLCGSYGVWIHQTGACHSNGIWCAHCRSIWTQPSNLLGASTASPIACSDCACHCGAFNGRLGPSAGSSHDCVCSRLLHQVCSEAILQLTLLAFVCQ
jgi:hypothetical protein